MGSFSWKEDSGGGGRKAGGGGEVTATRLIDFII